LIFYLLEDHIGQWIEILTDFFLTAKISLRGVKFNAWMHQVERIPSVSRRNAIGQKSFNLG